MATHTKTSIVGVFHDQAKAQRAVNDLKRAGFTDEQIGVIGRDSSGNTTRTKGDGTDSYAAEGGVAGLAAGAGVGALWGLGIISNILPAIGPAIAGGTLAAILSSAAAGAAAAGIAGSLVGLGLSKEEADYYESEFQSGRILVTVSADGRDAEARSILERNGAYDATHRSSTANMASPQTASMEACEASCQSASHTSASADTAKRSNLQSGSETVKAVDEELRIHKTPVQGEATVRKEVHTEHKTIDVPVTREEIVIERRAPGNTKASSADLGREEIHVPVMEEHVTVEKTPVVKEEVSVSKKKVQGTERVSENLRKEEIKIEKEGSVEVRDTRSNPKR